MPRRKILIIGHSNNAVLAETIAMKNFDVVASLPVTETGSTGDGLKDIISPLAYKNIIPNLTGKENRRLRRKQNRKLKYKL